MDARFSDVAILVWDFDGTLYKPIPQLWKDIREAEYRTIMDHTGWSKEKTIAEFGRLHKKVITSATATVAHLTKIPIAQAAIEMEKYFDRRTYVARDEKLIELFTKLKHFRHMTLANGVIANHEATLEVLGVPREMIERMVTSETVGVTKPDEKGFRYILNYTKIPPHQHLMIGDREDVDLVPAKKLGMRTCLVWSDTKGRIADITIASVYDIEKILL